MKQNINKSIYKKLVALTGISILSLASATAAVNLKVDDNIKVTAINGKEVNKSLFQPLAKEFTLEPGKHVITAKYDRLYELRGDEHDYLRSSNITVTADLQDNKDYKLAMLGQPERYKEAKEYVKNPTLAVVLGNTVVAKESTTTGEGGIFRSLTSALGVSNSAGQIDNQKTISAIETNQSTKTVPTISENADTLDRFMQLWLQATPDEREKIRQWIKK